MNPSMYKFGTVLGVLLLAGVLIVVLFNASTRDDPGQTLAVPAVPLSSTPQATETVTTEPSAYPTIPVTVIPTGTAVETTPLFTPDPTGLALSAKADYLNHLFYEAPGTVIAQGTNTTPIPHIYVNVSLTSYTVEEVSLPHSETWTLLQPGSVPGTLDARETTFSRFWRIIITGGPFIVANNGWTIWIDDTMVGIGNESGDTIITIITDPSLLREGARIGVGWGNSITGHEALPDPLHLNRVPSKH